MFKFHPFVRLHSPELMKNDSSDKEVKFPNVLWKSYMFLWNVELGYSFDLASKITLFEHKAESSGFPLVNINV